MLNNKCTLFKINSSEYTRLRSNIFILKNTLMKNQNKGTNHIFIIKLNITITLIKKLNADLTLNTIKSTLNKFTGHASCIKSIL